VDADTTYICVVTVREIELGVLQAERRDSRQGSSLREWFDELLKFYQGRIALIDTDVALKAASLHVPNPSPERDAIIAATGLVHGWTIVTRNVVDFDSTGVALVNPWIGE